MLTKTKTENNAREKKVLEERVFAMTIHSLKWGLVLLLKTLPGVLSGMAASGGPVLTNVRCTMATHSPTFRSGLAFGGFLVSLNHSG